MEETLTKIILSVVFGGVLGLERQYHDKPAGFATNCIICLGATLFTIVSQNVGAWGGGDPGRIAAQIVTGVGFIGAGAILRDGSKISGLTTAAGVWLVAAVGMAVGYGEYVLAASTAAAVLVVQLAVRKTMKLVEFVKRYDTFYLTCEPRWEVVEEIGRIIRQKKVTILKQEVTKQDRQFHVQLVATFTGKEFHDLTKELLEMPAVYSLYK